MDEWTSISSEMEQKYPKLFTKLLDEISKDSDPEEQVGKLIQGYEAGEEKRLNIC